MPRLKLIQDRIQNPLADLSTSELMADVEDFANENQLTDILPELRKGALVARDPANFHNLTELDDEEKRVLTREVTNRWSQTRTLYLTIITCSIGAAVQGWDQTGSNGANLSFPTAFGIGNGGSKSLHKVHLPRPPFLHTRTSFSMVRMLFLRISSLVEKLYDSLARATPEIER